MIRKAEDFGAPVTLPGGKVAPMSSGQPEPRTQSGTHPRYQMHQAGVGLDVQELGHPDRTRAGYHAKVIAHQVDDRDVLGPVLVQQTFGRDRGAL